jgi:hypothetical protein
MFGEGYRSWSSSLCSFLQSPVPFVIPTRRNPDRILKQGKADYFTGVLNSPWHRTGLGAARWRRHGCTAGVQHV